MGGADSKQFCADRGGGGGESADAAGGSDDADVDDGVDDDDGASSELLEKGRESGKIKIFLVKIVGILSISRLTVIDGEKLPFFP
jgi:hypothetical protein